MDSNLLKTDSNHLEYFKIDCLKKEWIRIYEEGFESYEEHQNFPENGFESDEKGFESVYELHVFPKSGFESA